MSYFFIVCLQNMDTFLDNSWLHVWEYKKTRSAFLFKRSLEYTFLGYFYVYPCVAPEIEFVVFLNYVANKWTSGEVCH